MRAWWSAREPRERQVLAIGGALTAVLLIWAFVWYPLQRSRSELRERVQAQRSELQQMRSDATRVAQLRGLGAQAKVERQGKSLLALADATARGAQLANELRRVEPVGPRACA